MTLMPSWVHYGVKTFKFEHAALELDFKGQPFFVHIVHTP